MSESIWVCLDCGKEYSKKPYGVCNSCGSFRNFEERFPGGDSSSNKKAGYKNLGASSSVPEANTLSKVNSNEVVRFSSDIGELDRVLGGGFVGGEVALLGGAPGAGKSSLALMVANNFSKRGKTVLYSSGEESEQQISLRAKRMNIAGDNILVINETNLEKLLGYVDKYSPDLVIVDSLQTIASDGVSGGIGSIQQSREAANTLTHLAKQRGIIMILINQVIKSEGSTTFAGSNQVSHIVDVTLMFESDRDSPLKFLRASKNRFGDTAEVGVFQHFDEGLMEVADPSGVLLDNHEPQLGSSISFVSEGIRQIPVEIQALVVPTNLPNPRKQFNGVEYNRGQIVCAILEKFCRLKLYNNDVFVSTVSGVKVSDPLADLSVAASILSSYNNSTFPTSTAFVGELSLTGQIRGSFMMDQKIREAERLGFSRIIVPEVSRKNTHIRSNRIEVVYMSDIYKLDKLLK